MELGFRILRSESTDISFSYSGFMRFRCHIIRLMGIGTGEMKITKEDVWKVFWWGVEYGQLLMEEERENEELFDAAVCYTSGLKFAVPSSPVRRRQLHSEKWFAAKQEGYRNFLDYYVSLNQTTKNKGSNDQRQFEFEEREHGSGT